MSFQCDNIQLTKKHTAFKT